jgi:SAM-dependent methyltransferase
MRRLPFRDGAFGLALSMFTSFGYFQDLEENAAVLDEAHRILAPEGGLVVDYFNARVTLDRLVAENHRPVGCYDTLERRRVDLLPGGLSRIVKSVTILEEGRTVDVFHESVLVLTAERLGALLQTAGFDIVDRLGDYDGAPFIEESSERCLLIARRRV